MELISIYVLASMFITILIIHLFYPEPQIILKYPSGSVSDLYIDENNVCYKYHKVEVECPKGVAN